MGGNFLFELIEPEPLRSQQDGRRLALEVLRAIRDAGGASCSAHPDDRREGPQCGAFLAALVKLERGSSQARAGFAVVLTDLLGRAVVGAVPLIFEEREQRGRFVRWRMGPSEGQTPSPERESAPESTGDCRPRSPDHDRA